MTHNIDIQTLRLFLKVAELGNISRAADALSLSQPSVSRSLKALELSLNAPLFYRTGHGVELTAIGALAIEQAKIVVQGCDGFVRDIRERSSGPTGVVSVALLTAYMRSFAADLFDKVQQKYPGVILRMVESFSAQHEEWLANGQVDIALVTEYRELRIANEDVLAQSNLALVGQGPCASDYPDIPFCDLNNLPLVLPASPNGLRVRMEEEALKQGISLRVIFEADSLEAQLALIRRARCYAIWSEHLTRQENYTNELHIRRIVAPTLPRYVVLRTTTHHPLSRAAREVAHLLRRLISDAHQEGPPSCNP
ncbi:LysR family transcriptional regulator [Pollutimonas bauzanensis]|uniref:LysR family transcriptional regulator n=1 Tax=Pollutimonas bauzanensis TaxID=658167 RepID=UPI003342741A